MSLNNGQLEQRTLALALLAAGIVSGLAVPSLTLILQPLALPALMVVVVLSLLPFARMPIATLAKADKSVWRLILWQQCFLPCVVVAIGIAARFSDSIILLMCVTACAGSLFASPMLAELLGLDRRFAVQSMVISTMVMPASLYVCLSMLHGTSVPLNLADYLTRTGVFLGLPFVVFGLHGRVVSHLSDKAVFHIDILARWGSVLALLVFGLGMMHSVSDLLAVDPSKALFFLLLSTTLTVGMFAFTAVVMRRYGLEIALTTGILSGFRNVGLGFALVGNSLGSDLAAYIGLSMVPMFIAPMIIRMSIAASTTNTPAMPAHQSVSVAL